MKNQHKVISKYLALYAEPCASWVLRDEMRPQVPYASATVIPLYAEEAHLFFSRLKARTKEEGGEDKKHLLIFVLNQPVEADETEKQKNVQFLEYLKRSYSLRASTERGLLMRYDGRCCSFDILVVNATTSHYCLKPREGVGRARKMGMDCALALYNEGWINSPMVGSADADVILTGEHFEVLEVEGAGKTGTPTALLFPYQHLMSGEFAIDQAMMQVEASFRYYVLGLAHAGSPYAYHSLGSALSVHLPSYAGVRGVPNRQAGEDFYLLSKLSQVGVVKRLAQPTRLIETRVSSRVPFGTGPSLARALDTQGEVLTYDPRCFEALRGFLQLLVDAALASSPNFAGAPVWMRKYAEMVWGGLSPELARCPGPEHRRRRLMERFDALSTLRFIHQVTDQSFPKIPLAQALTAAGIGGAHLGSCAQGWEQTLSHLRQMEAELPVQCGPWSPYPPHFPRIFALLSFE